MTVPHGSSLGDTLLQLISVLLTLLVDVMRFLRLCLRSSAALAADNLSPRKQLTLYQERKVTPRRELIGEAPIACIRSVRAIGKYWLQF
jgi:hypothetical protein